MLPRPGSIAGRAASHAHYHQVASGVTHEYLNGAARIPPFTFWLLGLLSDFDFCVDELISH